MRQPAPPSDGRSPGLFGHAAAEPAAHGKRRIARAVSNRQRNTKPRRRRFAALAWIAALAAGASAQEAERPLDVPGGADRPPAAERPSDTYVNDSFEAADAVAKAADFAADARWHSASELLQKASHDFGDKVIRLAPGRYVGVRAYVNRLVASWPPEGLDAYRAATEPELRARLLAVQGSRDIDDYLPLFEEFFCTRVALELAETLTELAVESGDFALATHILRETLEFHPGREEAAARLGATLAVVDGITGKAHSPLRDARLRWKGEERRVPDVLAEVGADFAQVRADSAGADWPIFAGGLERNRALSADVTQPGLLWRFYLVPPPRTTGEESADLVGRAQRESARRLAAFPVLGGDFLYAQFDRQIIALHRKTGAPAWRFESGSEFESDSFLDDQPPGWNSPTLSGGRLFAALPAEPSSYYEPESDRDGPELVSLDAHTGELLWSVDADCFEMKPGEFVLDSSPVVAGDRLYIVARRRRSFGFEDCYLYALRTSDGAVQFRVHLGGASTATFGSRTVAVSIAALHDATLYVCSGLGSIAAVSAYTGTVQWLRTYERLREPDAGVPGIAARDLVPRQFNPLIFAEDRLIALPTDSQNVLVFSPTGELERKLPRETVGGMQTLLGTRAGQVCGVGDDVVCFDLTDPSRQWTADLPLDQDLFGRACLTSDAIWVPTRRALLRYAPGSDRYSEFAWPRDGEGGNVLVTPDSIIVAEPTAVAAYGERERIWSALRERIDASPQDPLPPLEFAEVAFGAGQLQEALSALQLADRRLAGSPSAAEEEVRRRLFNDALAFAFGVGAGVGAAPDQAIEVCFNIGARQAWDRGSNVRYRTHFAGIFEALGEPARAASLYQQILRDRGLRQHTTSADADAAGEAAELSIAALIDRYGRPIYADIEFEAKQALEAASAARDNEAVGEVVRTFPNSQTATRALVMLGDSRLALGDLSATARAYTQAFHGENAPGDRAALVAKIADVHAQAARPDDAYLWLSKGVLQFPNVSLKQNGKKRTFAEMRERLLKETPGAVASRARIALPLREPARRSLDPGARLLTPLFADAPANRWSNYFSATPRTLAAYSARTFAPLWPEPATPPASADLLVQLDHVAIFATKYQVFSLDLAAGSLVWSLGSQPAHVADPGGDWEQGGAILGHALQDHLLVTGRDNGLFTALDIRNGKVLWSKTLPPPAGALQLAMPWLVYHTTEQDSSRIMLIDAGAGEAHGSIAADSRRPLEHLLVGFDGLAIAVSSKSVDCYEVETRRKRWTASLAGPVRAESLRLTPDGVVYGDSGTEIVKLATDDGRVVWRSAPVGDQGAEDLRVEVVDDQLLVLTSASVAAVDVASGVTLWTGTTPDDVRFARHLVAQDFVAALHVPRSDSEQPTAYLYQIRNGRIPTPGGTIDLDGVRAVDNALFIDGALLIQTPEALLSYTSGD